MQMTRCSWAKSDLMVAYHDSEWGVPQHDDRVLFEFLILEGAQAGLSWETVLKKRANYRAAFDSFDPAVVAKYTQAKIKKLLANEGIIRNRLKIHATITNAKAFLAVQKEFGSFDRCFERVAGFIAGVLKRVLGFFASVFQAVFGLFAVAIKTLTRGLIFFASRESSK